jgi:hypothetical protein
LTLPASLASLSNRVEEDGVTNEIDDIAKGTADPSLSDDQGDPSSWTALSKMLIDTNSQLTRPDLSGHPFSDLQSVLLDISVDAAAAAYIEGQKLWSATTADPEAVDQEARQLRSVLLRMLSLQVAPNDDLKAEISAIIMGRRNWLFKHVRPWQPSLPTVAINRQQLANEVVEAEKSQVEVRKILERLRTSTIQFGATTAAAVYENQAQTEDKTSRRFLYGMIGSIIALVASIVLLFFINPPTPTNIPQAISDTAARIVLVGILTFLVGFTAKNYRAHSHLKTVNIFKANALKATPLFQEGIATDAQRDVIVGELVRAVFTVPDTGLIGVNGDNLTIDSSALLNVLSARASGK